ncbi:MAG: hypothetical protein M1819_005794 [Sarea resinae]|nr:MAG: hypothetical protein M1819_005794 [Sarea resinae]
MANVDFGRYKRIVQYFWDPEPRNDDASKLPIWCLGRAYIAAENQSAPNGKAPSIPLPDDASPPGLPSSHISVATPTPEDSASSSVDDGLAYIESVGGAEEDRGWPSSFLDDFESKIWFTYRSNFPPITKSEDARAASAMTLSVRLRSHLLDQGGFTSDTGWGCMIRSGQSLLANALVLLQLGRGETAIILLDADTAGLRVYITGDGSDVYEDSVMNVAKAEDGSFRPTLLLVGIRLGIDRVTPVYWEALKASLQMPQSVGIAGGRPSSSHYFVGVQGSYFFYLDPHQTQPALPLRENLSDYTTEEVNSYHTRRLRRIHIREMDPSMLIAFLIRDEEDWKAWRRSLTEDHGKAVINVGDRQPTLHTQGYERADAVNEVETFDDETEEAEAVI